MDWTSLLVKLTPQKIAVQKKEKPRPNKRKKKKCRQGVKTNRLTSFGWGGKGREGDPTRTQKNRVCQNGEEGIQKKKKKKGPRARATSRDSHGIM